MNAPPLSLDTSNLKNNPTSQLFNHKKTKQQAFMLFVSHLKITKILSLEETGNYDNANMNHKYDDDYFFKFLNMSTTNELITLFKSTKEFTPIDKTGERTPTKNDYKKNQVVNRNEGIKHPSYFYSDSYI